MQIHTLILKPPNYKVIKLRTFDESSQIDIDLVEPVDSLPFPFQTLYEHFIGVVCLLDHGVEAILSDAVVDPFLPLKYFNGILNES